MLQLVCIFIIYFAKSQEPRVRCAFGSVCKSAHDGVVGGPSQPSRFAGCVLLALSWNTDENMSTDKLSKAINYSQPG